MRLNSLNTFSKLSSATTSTKQDKPKSAQGQVAKHTSTQSSTHVQQQKKLQQPLGQWFLKQLLEQKLQSHIAMQM